MRLVFHPDAVGGVLFDSIVHVRLYAFRELEKRIQLSLMNAFQSNPSVLKSQLTCIGIMNAARCV